MGSWVRLFVTYIHLRFWIFMDCEVLDCVCSLYSLEKVGWINWWRLSKFWVLQHGKKSNVWILITQSSSSLKSKLIPGTRQVHSWHCLKTSWEYDFFHSRPSSFSRTLQSDSLLCSTPQVFHKRMPPEAVDLVSRLLQYSPNLRCSAVCFLSCLCLAVFPHFFGCKSNFLVQSRKECTDFNPQELFKLQFMSSLAATPKSGKFV
jgi:hypothetical protein